MPCSADNIGHDIFGLPHTMLPAALELMEATAPRAYITNSGGVKFPPRSRRQILST